MTIIAQNLGNGIVALVSDDYICGPIHYMFLSPYNQSQSLAKVLLEFVIGGLGLMIASSLKKEYQKLREATYRLSFDCIGAGLDGLLALHEEKSAPS